MKIFVSPERWGRVKEVFQGALERPAAERAAWLESACGDEPALAAEVGSLLASHAASEDFLDRPASDVVSRALEEAPPPGGTVGPYRLQEPIGRGGMGTVWLAERVDGVFRRRVAVKLVARGMDTDAIVERFRRERQILADLEHPNIARLIDGGATSDGRPYFVLEHVEGLRIDRFCVEHGLAVEKRLELFAAVCDVVQYAHRRLIVHRDLKPGNILVTADGVPKLLDFGIAKVLAAVGVPEATEDRSGQALTPEYASPEQIRGGPITVATDVYSLGTLLYVLLTERHPHPVESRRADEFARLVCEEEPPRPSAVVADRRLRARLRGDLDTIVAAALRKEPERRYPSVERLAEDVRRHLGGLPVRARPDTVRYRGGKFVRRHRLGVTAAAVVLATLVAGVGATVWQMRVARAERALAERRFEDVRQLARLFLFDYNKAIEPLPGSTPVQERMVRDAFAYLDMLARESERDLVLQRELAEGYEKVGEIQARMGDIGGALVSHRRSRDLYLRVVAEAPGDVEARQKLARSHLYVADRLTDTGHADAALEEHRKAMALRQEATRRRPDDPVALRDLWDSQLFVGRAMLAVGGFEEALALFHEALRLAETLARVDPDRTARRIDLLTSHYTLAMGRAAVGDHPAALAGYRRALAYAREISAAEPVNANHRQALSRSNRRVGEMLGRVGQPAPALEHLMEARRISQRLTEENPANQETRIDLVLIHASIGGVLRDLGRVGEARASLDRSRDMGEEALRFDPENDRLRAALSRTYRALGELALEGGDAAEAAIFVGRAATLFTALAEEDRQNVEIRQERAITRDVLAAVLEARTADLTSPSARRATRAAACAERDRSGAEWGAMEAAGVLSPLYRDRPAVARAEGESCRAALARTA